MTTEQQFTGLKVGQTVPDFEMDTYDPAEYYFGKISFEQLKKEKNGLYSFSIQQILPLFEQLSLLLWQGSMKNSSPLAPK